MRIGRISNGALAALGAVTIAMTGVAGANAAPPPGNAAVTPGSATVSPGVAPAAGAVPGAATSDMIAAGAPAKKHSVRVASYNVLGAHLSDAKRGKRAHYPDSRWRMRQSLRYFEAGKYPIEIVALQELETKAATVIKADPDWGMLRATPNPDSRKWGGGNAVIWRKSTWKLHNHWEYDVHYSSDGTAKVLHYPVARLQNRATGLIVTVISVHQPTNTKGHPGQGKERPKVRHELRAQLARHKNWAHRVLVLGDFNESLDVACPWTTKRFMKDATGYRNAKAKGCTGFKKRQGGIDRIFGAGRLNFAGHGTYRRTANEQWSDHPLKSATVRFWR